MRPPQHISPPPPLLRGWFEPWRHQQRWRWCRRGRGRRRWRWRRRRQGRGLGRVCTGSHQWGAALGRRRDLEEVEGVTRRANSQTEEEVEEEAEVVVEVEEEEEEEGELRQLRRRIRFCQYSPLLWPILSLPLHSRRGTLRVITLGTLGGPLRATSHQRSTLRGTLGGTLWPISQQQWIPL